MEGTCIRRPAFTKRTKTVPVLVEALVPLALRHQRNAEIGVELRQARIEFHRGLIVVDR